MIGKKTALGRVIASDLLKLKGKGLWFLICLGPIGLIAMQALNFGLRFDYLQTAYGGEMWAALLDNLLVFVPIALLMGIAIFCSLMASIEHHTSSWKQLLALPVSRLTVFASKFAVAASMLAVSSMLLALGTVMLGLLMGFGGDIPIAEIAKLSFLPYLASWPLLALLLWLCVTMRNQSVPLTLGIVMAVVSIFPLGDWVPLNWPMLAYASVEPQWFVLAGLLGGLAVLVVGMLHFNRKDVS
ncbi:ABC transporter permease [Paenibacillus sp. GCM10027627]|uniref:ABC transporter permease n=1 Tax=unclassified Paenibacillus TaxID=185978 RepID=UPI003644A18F